MRNVRKNLLNNIFKFDYVDESPIHTEKELINWIKDINRNKHVKLDYISLEDCEPWYYDEGLGCIKNRDNSFFRIYGIRESCKNRTVFEQPIIMQDEIGFLGIIACKINNTWHYLMQAKIEPGNINHVQIAPTLQATKSNFTKKHGGKTPLYLNYFLNMNSKDIIVDQIQSEHSSKFYKKRNRNVILAVDEVIPESDTHKWMTLKQIKSLMSYNNIVNMDTRTVISCLPDEKHINNFDYKEIIKIYNLINNYKMFNENKVELIKLKDLKLWEMKNNEFRCKNHYPFKVIFCDIEINNREVSKWRQPLFAACKQSMYGLFCCNDNGIMKFLVSLMAEPGCIDGVEIGPTIQDEMIHNENYTYIDEVEKIFHDKLKNNENVIYDCILSEEGGRFYHYSNRNVIIFINKEDITDVDTKYTWVDYATLKILIQINNCLNIQLRNLLSLLTI